MSVYIEKQAAIDALGKPPEVYSWEDALMREQWERDKAAIEAVPPADVRPAVRGKWVSDEDTYSGHGMRNYKCSACGEIAGTWRKGLKKEQLYPFCPMCGAGMREDKP